MRDGGLIFWMAVAIVILIVIARAYFKKYEKEKSTLVVSRNTVSELSKNISDVRAEFAKSNAENKQLVERKDYLITGLTRIIDERKSQFPWLASGFADLRKLIAERDANLLEKKKHPAMKGAELVREHGQKQREAIREARLFRYRAEYYEKLFPWIADYVGDDVPDSVVDISGIQSVDEDDPAKQWLSAAEYERLSPAEKYQKALDNWKRRKRTSWQVGRDYERFVGYVYETQGYDVRFSGAIDGLEDMGRDVIAVRERELAIIQCKYWSSEKLIREKHIFQLFASALEYGFRRGGLVKSGQYSFSVADDKAQKISPILYTSTKLSDVARDVAKLLDVTIYEEVRISDYPIIKCNVALRDGQRIYHLPFDQQYDRVKIKKKGETYAYTVADAENLGFRRAWRWHPEE